MSNKRIILYFILILLFGAGLRIYQLDTKSIWLDEAFSIRLSEGTLSQIIAGEKNAPPLYHFILHYWLKLWGDSENGARSLSVLFSILAIPLLYGIAKRLLTPQIGLISMAILAFSPFHIYYAQEARMYAQLVFFTLLSVWFLLYSMDKNRWYCWMGYIIANTAAVYTHYYGVFVVAAETILLIFFWKKETRFRKLWLSSLIAIIVLYIPWIEITLTVLGKGGQAWRSHLLLHIIQTFFSFSLGYSALIIDTLAKQNLIAALKPQIPIMILFCLSFMVVFLLGIKQALQNRRAALILFTLLFGIIGLAVIISLKLMLYSASYLIICSPFFYIILALGLIRIRNKYLRYGEIILLSGLVLFSLWSYYFNPRFGKDQYREAARFVAGKEQGNEIILMHKPYIGLTFNYYYRGQLPEHPLPEQVISDTSPDFAAIQSLLKKYQRFWLVLTQNYDTGTAYPDLMTKHYQLLLKQEYPVNNGITVYLFQVQ